MRTVPRGRLTPGELAWALLSLVLLATGAAGAYFPPLAALIPGCALRRVSGFRCPTCGSGTALAWLARGEVAAAVRSNWLAVAAVAVLLGFDLYLALTFVLGGRLEVQLTRRGARLMLAAGLICLALAWVLQGR